MSHHGQRDISNRGHRHGRKQQSLRIYAGGNRQVPPTHFPGKARRPWRYHSLQLVGEADRRRIQEYHGLYLMGVPVLRRVPSRNVATQRMAYQDDPVRCQMKGGQQVMQEPGAVGKRLPALGLGAAALSRPIVRADFGDAAQPVLDEGERGERFGQPSKQKDGRRRRPFRPAAFDGYGVTVNAYHSGRARGAAISGV